MPDIKALQDELNRAVSARRTARDTRDSAGIAAADRAWAAALSRVCTARRQIAAAEKIAAITPLEWRMAPACL